MLYMRCPTCGELLGNKELIMIEKLKKVCDDLEIDDEMISQGYDKHPEYVQKRQKIISDLCNKICCRIRMMTYVDIVKIIK